MVRTLNWGATDMKGLMSWLIGTLLSVGILIAGPGVWWYDRHFQGWHCCFGFIRVPPGVGVQLATLQAAEEAAQARAAAEQARVAAISAAANAHEAVVQTQIVTQTRTITKEIPTYVTPAIDQRYPLPWVFVRVHDAAARGVDVSTIPLPAGELDDASSGIPTSDVATIIAGNYGKCRGDAQQLTDLQTWIRQVSRS